MYSFGIKKRTSRYKQNQTHNIQQLTILPDSFEWTHYLIMNMDLIDNNIITKEDAEKHWIQHGYAESRNYTDNNSFPWRRYLIANPKLLEENILYKEEAYEHWITIGRQNKYRLETPDFNWKIYAAINPDLHANSILSENEVLEHWIYHGYNEDRSYKLIDFDWLFYITFNCLYHEYINTETQAVLHWLHNGKHKNISHATLLNHYSKMKDYDYSALSQRPPNKYTQSLRIENDKVNETNSLDQIYVHDIVKRNTPVFRYLEPVQNIDSFFKRFNAFTLIIDFPCFGGGCSFFLNSIITKYKNNMDFLIVRAFKDNIHWYVNDEHILNYSTHIDDAFHLLNKVVPKIRKIFINSIIGHQSKFLDKVMSYGIEVSTITHDFRLVFDDPHKYFYELEHENPNNIIDFSKINRIFTQNVGNLHTFGRFFTKKNTIHVSPLPDFKKALKRIETNNEKTVIGVLGDISDVKGCILVYHIAKLIKTQPEKYELIVFGNINVPYVTKYPYTSIRHLNTLLENHKPNLWLETSLWPETYSYTLTLMKITRLPILYQNKFYNCAVQNRIKEYPSAFSYNSIEDVSLNTISNIKKNHLFTIEPTIYYPDIWEQYFSSYNKLVTQPKILHDKMDKKNIVMITSKIYTTTKPFSYSDTRSIYTPEERFQQTLNTIQTIKETIPDVIIVLFDNSKFTDVQYSTLDKAVHYFLNVTNNKIVNEYTNNSRYKIYGEIVQTLELLVFIEKTLKYKVGIRNVFKISGRYLINEDFDYNKYNNDDIILKQNMDVLDRKYYFTCFYKFGYNCFDKIYNVIQDVYDGMKGNKHANKDWEVLLPELLHYDFHEIETLGITQNIAVWNDKTRI